MKLILKHYLSSLKERGELDAILPDLLTQMGLQVFSRPSPGQREYGVDIAAVGQLDDGPETVYLISVKSGDLTRQEWNSGSPDNLQPSLDEILNTYIPTHLPIEHRNKPITICICIGGEIKKTVRLNVTTYEQTRGSAQIKFAEWNGDILANWIEKYLLNEELMLSDVRSLLRKSLALLDDPQASFIYFSKLIHELCRHDRRDRSKLLQSLRQLHICLWILYSWSRDPDIDNIESAYLSAELALLHAWDIAKGEFEKQDALADSIADAFLAIHQTYQAICNHYISQKIAPHVDKLHGISVAVGSTNKLDVNLKTFDVLGRLSLAAIWSFWHAYLAETQGDESKAAYQKLFDQYQRMIGQLINNNKALLLPVKDEFAIEIALTLLALGLGQGTDNFMSQWLREMVNRSTFAFKFHKDYPCVYKEYRELIDHPQHNDEYRRDATAGSILYPLIAAWAALLEDGELYNSILEAKAELFSHCNFQMWFPDETTEENIYINTETHGAIASDVPLEQGSQKLLDFVWNEIDGSDHFKNLSAHKRGLWPIILVACRHHRNPVPLDFLSFFRTDSENTDSAISETPNE